jgi:hypothetical protein
MSQPLSPQEIVFETRSNTPTEVMSDVSEWELDITYEAELVAISNLINSLFGNTRLPAIVLKSYILDIKRDLLAIGGVLMDEFHIELNIFSNADSLLRMLRSTVNLLLSQSIV